MDFATAIAALMVLGIGLGIIAIPLVIILIIASLKVVQEYERGVKLRFGKYVGMMSPGLRIVIPVIEKWFRVDMRVAVVDVPPQDAITMDNVTVKVNAVLYYKVVDATKSILEVEQYHYATSQLAQTTMRDVVGRVDLDSLLAQRQDVSNRIQQIVDIETDLWGIQVQSVELKHIDLLGGMKRTMAKQAEAEREKRAVIIKAQGEEIAAENIALAAEQLAETPGGLHLRTLHTINDLSSDKSDTIVVALPVAMLRGFSSGKLKDIVKLAIDKKKR